MRLVIVVAILAVALVAACTAQQQLPAFDSGLGELPQPQAAVEDAQQAATETVAEIAEISEAAEEDGEVAELLQDDLDDAVTDLERLE